MFTGDAVICSENRQKPGEAERKWKQVGDKDREARLRCFGHSGIGMDKEFCAMYPLPGKMKSARS